MPSFPPNLINISMVEGVIIFPRSKLYSQFFKISRYLKMYIKIHYHYSVLMLTTLRGLSGWLTSEFKQTHTCK